MSNIVPLLRNPPPSEAVAVEFGRDLYAGRQDTSDPEACFHFLYVQHPDRWREVMANLDGAINEAGQIYIAADISRAG